MAKKSSFQELHTLTPDKLTLARQILEDVRDGTPVQEAVRRHPTLKGYVSKSTLVATYYELIESGEWDADDSFLSSIRLKPVRTLSGVTTVTVLTKPYPCPGKCIFCPDDVRMPKSYLPDEPGAMRALEHNFDPYTQVKSRLEALNSVGHPTDKVELLILGGTFSSYRRDYQEWFVQRCFEAMNEVERGNPEPPASGQTREQNTVPDTGRELLSDTHFINESATHRNVGLSVETRPDEVTPNELAWFRHLGVTKVQMGVQSLDDRILDLNQRGHSVEAARQATALLRAGGFKIVLHWMPNLLGATLESDLEDFPRLWEGLCPDEIKIYPTQLLENAPLYENWRKGEYHPYSTEELVQLIADVKPSIPRYCRVNRIIRDIPSQHVVEGNRRTSLRQDVHAELARRGTHCDCIRCREVRGEKVQVKELQVNDLVYHPDGAEEHFLSFVTPDDRIAGFLRLSLPGQDSPETDLEDLHKAAIIREVHVYGQSLAVGAEKDGAAQHAGLGTRLLSLADKIASDKGYRRMAVIAAVGTHQYYLERGFQRGKLYLVKGI
jgi:elongator complex protein 3